MNIEITIVKTFCDFGHNFFKKAVLAIFCQDFVHKLRKNLATLVHATVHAFSAAINQE